MGTKKIYHAPSVEIVLFAPCEGIAANHKFGKNNGWWGWNDNSAWWGLKPDGSVVTGALNVSDEDGKTWTLPD